MNFSKATTARVIKTFDKLSQIYIDNVIKNKKFINNERSCRDKELIKNMLIVV